MSGETIKKILYSTIEEVGKEKIRIDVSADLESSRKYIDVIMKQCAPKLTNLKTYDHDTVFGIMAEALLHFMLTISTLPSERKVEIGDGLTADIIVPSLASLRRNTKTSIIIQIIKNRIADINKVKLLEALQPNPQNIWLISTRPHSFAKYKEYSIFPSQGSYDYSNIITDTDRFLQVTKDKSFRFVP